MTTKPLIIDDKSPHCIPFILSHLQAHRQHSPNVPFFIGVNAIQGAGKTTLVKALFSKLQEQEHLETLVLSIDDLYLTHHDQVALATQHADNPLVQHRGEPGTHDIPLAHRLFQALKSQSPTPVPQYDKSAFAGQGDRTATSTWVSVNTGPQPKISLVILEGWCVGFRALSDAALEEKVQAAELTRTATLYRHEMAHLRFVNERLREYDVLTDAFDAFIHVDAEETEWVYGWRLQQEEELRRERGTGMTDEEVVKFVDGHYPAYELFTEELRKGVFKGEGVERRQLRLVVGKDRRVKEVYLI